MAGTPDDLFLDLDDLPDVPPQEAEPATDHPPSLTGEEEAVPPLEETATPQLVAAITEAAPDPFAFAMPSLDDALRADGLFEDGEELPAQEVEDEPASDDAAEVLPAPGLEVREQVDGWPELPQVSSPYEPLDYAVEPELDLKPGAAAPVEDESASEQAITEPAAQSEPHQCQRAEQATVSIPHQDEGFVADPADVVAPAPPKRRQLVWIGSGIALTVAIALAVFLALPISKESAPASEEVASSTPVDPKVRLSEPEVVEPTPETTADAVADVIAADEAEPIVAPAPEPTEPTPAPVVEATPPQSQPPAKPVVKRTPVAAKPTPKPAPEKRDWQDDALESLDAFEKHL